MTRNPVLRGRAFVPLLLLVLGLASCAKKNRIVDPTFTTPEGVRSANARMVVYPTLPNYLFTFVDKAPFGETDPGDSLTGSFSIYQGSAGTVQGMIFDGTDATGFSVFRKESNGGVRPFQDHVVPRTKRWLDSHWELYHFVDEAPSSYSPPTYVGRGEIFGQTTPDSPLTNDAELRSRTIQFLDVTHDFAPGGLRFDWPAVPGATGYWLHVYVFRLDLRSSFEQFLSGIPSPLYDFRSSDIFVGFVPGSTAIDTLGNANGEVLYFRRPISLNFLVRVAAVNDRGELLAITPGTAVRINGINGEGTFALYLGGGYVPAFDENGNPVTTDYQTTLLRSLVSDYRDFEPGASTAPAAAPSGLSPEFLAGQPAGTVIRRGALPVRSTSPQQPAAGPRVGITIPIDPID